MVQFAGRIVGLVVVSIVLLGALVMPVGVSAQGNSEAAHLCHNGGYLDYTDANGNDFKNEGQCTRYAARGGTLVERLTPCEQAIVAAGFDPDDFDNIVSGTEGSDRLTYEGTTGSVAFCGFGGADYTYTVAGEEYIYELREGDLFLGGEGNDYVGVNDGTFNGDAGDDEVEYYMYGTFNGGTGNDFVYLNRGTFNGGEGYDWVVFNEGTCNDVEVGC